MIKVRNDKKILISVFLTWHGLTKLYSCRCSRVFDEEVETWRDEAGPSTMGVSFSCPCKLQARRPRAPSPARTETSGSDDGSLGLGEVPHYPPPRRARTAAELAELGQVRLILCV